MKKNSSATYPLLLHNNNILYRTAIIIRNSNGEVNTQTQIVLSLHNNLKKKMNNRINELNQFSFTSIPQIRVKLTPNPTEIDQAKDLRIIISTNVKAPYNITTEYFNKAELSHIVEVDFSLDASSAHNKPNVNAIYAAASIEAIEDFCVDVLTDIAMYHSWSGFTSSTNDLSFRRNLSGKKLDYAYEHHLPIPESVKQTAHGNPNYYSFAFSCHESESGSFNCQKYEALWVDFLKPYILDDSLVSLSLEEQLNHFTKDKQLARRKIEREYAKNPMPGPYIMLMMQRCPKRNLETERILTLFGRHKWKNGTVKIVPLAAYNKVARYYPYLAFFKIIRPKC